MAKLAGGAILIFATLVLASAVIINTNVGRRRREAAAMGVPMDCVLEFNVPRRDEPNVVDFVVCIQKDGVCTSRFVQSCDEDTKVKCEGLKPEPVDEEFHKLYKDAYAQVCGDPSTGENCIYSDVVYAECSTAKEQNEDEICITLSNGEVECATLPEDMMQRMSMMSQLATMADLEKYLTRKEIHQYIAKKKE